MPWVVGIDEAGYGPNLGPLLQAAVAVRLPADDVAGWETLKPHVRRAGEKADKRVLVDDSKLVHTGKHGLVKLERGVTAVLGVPAGPLADWLGTVLLPDRLADLRADPWFAGDSGLPLFPDPPPSLADAFAARDVSARICAVNAVPATVFNQVVAGSGSKATVLSIGLVELLRAADRTLPPGEPLVVIADKQGGRNFYGPVLLGAFPDGWVVAECESAVESRYCVENLARPVRVIFRPEADSGSISVALASMLCKYVREVCMRQFNRFWAGHVPGLKPTAGYPVDAKRFYAEIRPALARLGLPDDRVWRVK
ncbi:MAG: hypothetical protein ACRC7O_11095 [Fimbriiglobus sp.]